MIATLRREGGAVPLVFGSGASAVELPDLDDATMVVLAGASAGGGGVVNNVDRLATLLRANDSRCAAGGPCPLEVRALLDSTYGAPLARLDLSTATTCTGAAHLCTYEQLFRHEATAGSGTFWGRRVDDSCIAWHQSNAPGSEWICQDNDHVLEHHLTTPMFVRQGQRDELLSGNAIDAGFTVPGRGLITLQSFAELVRAQVSALANLQTTAHEGAAITVAPAGFSPTCPKHETISSSLNVFNVAVAQGAAT